MNLSPGYFLHRAEHIMVCNCSASGLFSSFDPFMPSGQLDESIHQLRDVWFVYVFTLFYFLSFLFRCEGSHPLVLCK